MKDEVNATMAHVGSCRFAAMFNEIYAIISRKNHQMPF
jgi:hypothetical protein